MIMPSKKSFAYSWNPISNTDLDSWNERLLRTSAQYHQFPFWNETYRMLKFEPVYLTWTQNGVPCAYVCLLSLGLPGYRFGLIHNGPVNLESDGPVPLIVLEELKQWAKQNGFVFLRFTGFNAELLETIAYLAQASRVNPFPFYSLGHNQALLVELKDSEEEMLASFQRVARQNIAQARRAGYEIRVSDDAKDLEEAWILFQRLTQRKGFALKRPQEMWADIIRRASPQKCARIYTARLDSRLLQVILVVRDARIAECKLAALDMEALAGNYSPTSLLQWHAMRESYQLGCKYYNLGPPSGAVGTYKSKFRPVLKESQPAVTLITKPASYRMWSKIGLPIISKLWPQLLNSMTRVIGSRKSE
jgi:hypothetical protein